MAKGVRYGAAASTVTYRSEWNSWNAMRHRCRNPKMTQYDDYGGRGINVCDDWYSSFPKFLADMGPKPSPQHVLSRRDLLQDFNAGNCIWGTRGYVGSHPDRRPSSKGKKDAVAMMDQEYTHNGHTMTIREWAAKHRLQDFRVIERLKKGMTIAQSLNLEA